MISNRRANSSSRTRRHCALIIAMLALGAAVACQSGGGTSDNTARGVIVINAPAAGEVRRVLVREGMTINEGTPMVEIVVQTEAPLSAPTPGENAETRAARNYKAADAEIEAARAEAVRHESEVQRLTPLVADGEASQAQLDGERALFERAQQRLQRAQEAKRSAESGLLSARQQSENQRSAPVAPREQTVAAVATSAGTVSAITARVGERVKQGQPLATLRAN